MATQDDLSAIISLVKENKELFLQLQKSDPELYEATKDFLLALLEVCEKANV